MKKRLIIFYLIYSVFYIGCKSKTTSEEGLEIFVKFKTGMRLNLSAICSGISYLPLKGSQPFFIGSIDKAVFTKEKIFMLDKKQMKMFTFNQNGTLLNQLNRQGRGPGEYNFINDFLIDTVNKTIELLDLGKRKIIINDLNYNYINERDKPGYFDFFSKISSNKYLFFADNRINASFYSKNGSYNVAVMDTLNNLLGSFLPIKFKNGSADVPQLSPYENGVMVIPFYDDKIYFVTTEECQTKYRIRFSNNTKPDHFYDAVNKLDETAYEAISNAEQRIFKQLSQAQYIICIFNVLENGRFLIFQFSQDRHPLYTAVYCKKSGKVLAGELINDIDGGLAGQPIALQGDTLTTYIFPHQFQWKQKSSGNKKVMQNENIRIPDKVNELLSSYQDKENPFLLKIALKEF